MGINIRLKPEERALMEADIAAIAASGGIRPKLSAYAKHGMLSHPRLRKLEAAVRSLAQDDDMPEGSEWAARTLEALR